MNAFSKSYKPVIDSASITRDAKQSARSTAARAAGMQSDDPVRRTAAKGTLPALNVGRSRADKSNSRV